MKIKTNFSLNIAWQQKSIPRINTSKKKAEGKMKVQGNFKTNWLAKMIELLRISQQKTLINSLNQTNIKAVRN